MIEHVAAWVLDLERARAFYERWFGTKAGPRYESTRRPFQSHFLSFGEGARLELMAAPQEAPRLSHIAVSVGSREAVDALVRRMRAEGVTILGEPRETGDGYCEAVIADSEGNVVEITG